MARANCCLRTHLFKRARKTAAKAIVKTRKKRLFRLNKSECVGVGSDTLSSNPGTDVKTTIQGGTGGREKKGLLGKDSLLLTLRSKPRRPLEGAVEEDYESRGGKKPEQKDRKRTAR